MKICFNGNLYPVSAPLLPVQNRSYKWGDGLFETMKVFENRILLEDLHFERLFTGLQLLQIECGEDFTPEKLSQTILLLCAENNCRQSARVRLAIFREETNKAGYSIEASPLPLETNEWQTNGQRICLYPYARKPMDAFANLKSANYLPYVLAQRFAQEKGTDDALLLNSANLLCDSSKANLFLLKDSTVITPALHQGCVAGVVRRKLIEVVKKMGLRLRQTELHEDDLLNADEVFLTNAIQLLRWVKTYRHREYECEQTAKIFASLHATIFNVSC